MSRLEFRPAEVVTARPVFALFRVHGVAGWEMNGRNVTFAGHPVLKSLCLVMAASDLSL